MIDKAHWKLKGADELDRKTKRIMARLKNTRAVYGKALAVVDRWVQKNFQTEGRLANDGARWKELKPATIRRRRRSGKAIGKTTKAAMKRSGVPGPVQILQDKGMLRSNWKHYFGRDKVAVQSGVPYGIYHDSDKPRKRLPQRKIVPRQKQVGADIRKVIEAEVKRMNR